MSWNAGSPEKAYEQGYIDAQRGNKYSPPIDYQAAYDAGWESGKGR